MLDLLEGRAASYQIEKRYVHRDGSILWGLLSASLVRGPDGVAVYGIAQVQDITGRKYMEAALRESEDRFRSANLHAAVGMALVTTDYTITQANPALEAILGYAENGLINRSVREITYPDDYELDVALAHRLLAGELDSFQLEKRYIHRDGSTIWGSLNVSLVRALNGEPLYFIAQLQDITEAKRVEQELRLARRRLAESREAERLHLARELHDGAVQQLLGISYQLVASPQRATDHDEPTVAQSDARALKTEVVRKQLLEVVSQLRGLMRELRPPGLEEFGLPAALEGYVGQLLCGV